MNTNEKLREALEWAINECKEREDGGEYLGEGSDPAFENIRWCLQEALALPRRNCDVGTAEEQVKRWDEFCIYHHASWKPGLPIAQPCNCPCYKDNQCNRFEWAQLPYEEVKE